MYVKTLCVQDVEKELEVQIGMKQEMELSMKMLEKDVCEKQDALVELRQQLEDLRVINQQLNHKSQVRRMFSPRRMLSSFTAQNIHTCPRLRLWFLSVESVNDCIIIIYKIWTVICIKTLDDSCRKEKL